MKLISLNYITIRIFVTFILLEELSFFLTVVVVTVYLVVLVMDAFMMETEREMLPPLAFSWLAHFPHSLSLSTNVSFSYLFLLLLLSFHLFHSV